MSRDVISSCAANEKLRLRACVCVCARFPPLTARCIVEPTMLWSSTGMDKLLVRTDTLLRHASKRARRFIRAHVDVLSFWLAGWLSGQATGLHHNVPRLVDSWPAILRASSTSMSPQNTHLKKSTSRLCVCRLLVTVGSCATPSAETSNSHFLVLHLDTAQKRLALDCARAASYCLFRRHRKKAESSVSATASPVFWFVR